MVAKSKSKAFIEGPAQRRGINSVEVGIRVLQALQGSPGPLTLTAVSEAAGMPASKAHRYLASYIRSGLVRQNPVTRRYELGPLALNLGLAALSQLDLIALSSIAADSITESTGLTSLMSVWSDKGAVIVRWNRGIHPVITSLALGSVLPPLSSASGQVFLAHLPRAATANAVRLEQKERQRLQQKPLMERAIGELIHKVRNQRAAWIDGGFIPGLRAFACPILDYQGHAAAVITLISATDPIADPRHSAARSLVEKCENVTRQAGTFELSGPHFRSET